jgi:hypothetical protein
MLDRARIAATGWNVSPSSLDSRWVGRLNVEDRRFVVGAASPYIRKDLRGGILVRVDRLKDDSTS